MDSAGGTFGRVGPGGRDQELPVRKRHLLSEGPSDDIGCELPLLHEHVPSWAKRQPHSVALIDDVLGAGGALQQALHTWSLDPRCLRQRLRFMIADGGIRLCTIAAA